MIKINEISMIFGFGAIGYSLLEIAWRGFTHWTMTLTGGLCFVLIYIMNILFLNKNIFLKSLLGAIIITSAELLVGSIVNLRLNWNVWDYSSQPLDFFGQICLVYSLLWFLLCIPLMPLCTKIRSHFCITANQRNISHGITK